MARGTPAVQILEDAGVEYALREYTAAAGGASYGEAAADALGVDRERVFKTLIAFVDGAPVVAAVPVSGTLSLKRLAKAVGGKSAVMADPADAERLTGYVVGGISPFGQRRRLPVYVDSTVVDHGTILVSAGHRGLQLEVAPSDLIAILDAHIASIGA